MLPGVPDEHLKILEASVQENLFPVRGDAANKLPRNGKVLRELPGGVVCLNDDTVSIFPPYGADSLGEGEYLRSRLDSLERLNRSTDVLISASHCLPPSRLAGLCRKVPARKRE